MLASSRFLNSRVLSRGAPQNSHGQSSAAWAQESRCGYKRSSSSGWEEDEVTLQSLKAHGQTPGKDGRGFGTTTSAWYQEESRVDRVLEMGSSPLSVESESIVVTTTRNVTSI